MCDIATVSARTTHTYPSYLGPTYPSYLGPLQDLLVINEVKQFRAMI